MKFKYMPNKILVFDNNKLAGELDYQIKETTLTITHTVVSPDMRGQGIGAKLTLELINFAKQNNFKIFPQCSYAQHFFKINPQYNKLLEIL